MRYRLEDADGNVVLNGETNTATCYMEWDDRGHRRSFVAHHIVYPWEPRGNAPPSSAAGEFDGAILVYREKVKQGHVV